MCFLKKDYPDSHFVLFKLMLSSKEKIVKNVFCYFLLFAIFALAACSTYQDNGVIKTSQWRYATDSHGSNATLASAITHKDPIEISFYRVPRVDALNNSWVELIYDLPGAYLPQQAQFTLTYQSDQPLIIKLSQKDYGKEGDRSYAHYQTILPNSQVWKTMTVTLNDFQRPHWTPSTSEDKGIINSHVSAIYFVPSLNDEQGGHAKLKIKSLDISH